MKILIVEDEQAAARRLEKLLLEIAPETEILAHLESVEACLNWLQQHPAPDFTALLEHIRKQEAPNYLRRMLIRLGNSIKLIDMSDAAFFYTKDKITFLIAHSTGKRFPVDYPLDKLETMLDPKDFFRINRQFILRINAIKEMQPYSKSRIKVETTPAADQEIIVSTERAAAFKRWLVGEAV
ncbi:MAG: LytR/AlgR family response regulator transcription factor [Saprospiraceae bacterium]|jgi:DNA-binding LytR/AlgR family response regulator